MGQDAGKTDAPVASLANGSHNKPIAFFRAVDTEYTMRITQLCVFAVAICGISGALASAKPDLSGTYDIATLTPLERPESFGDKLHVTHSEARSVAAESLAEVFKRAKLKPSDPDRGAPPVGGDTNPACNVGGYNNFWIDNGEDVFAVGGKYRTSILTYPADGRRPPLTPTGKRREQQQIAQSPPNVGRATWLETNGSGPYDNPENRPLAERCLLGFGPVGGPPMVPALYNNVKRIIQTEHHVMIMAEMVHDARVVRMNAAHRPAHVRTWQGDSIGWWEGDTLVVETTHFKPQSALAFADENLKVTERFSRIDAATLRYSFVVEDPTVWSGSWGGDYPWPATAAKLFEYACHEGNYALGNIMRGARLLEEEYKSEKTTGAR